MTTTEPSPRPRLAMRRGAMDKIETPFGGDLLQRAAVADRLTRYIDRLPDGAVIALDAPWGEGKTWFGRHWEASLKARGHQVGWIDAFQQDYAEDAFLLLSSAVLRLCTEHDSRTGQLKHRAGAVLRALLPVGTKALINLAGRAIGTTDLADNVKEAMEAASDKGAEAASDWIKGRLDQWEEEQQTVEHFREALTAFTEAAFTATGKPVVILIDELDRCRPAFAVGLIERIKHFFDVPKLIFVLLMNRDQLEKAIRGVYGGETDAAAYLGKFLHLSLCLPKDRTRTEFNEQSGVYAFVRSMLTQVGVTDHVFLNTFSVCASVFDLSLRDIERGCTLFALSEHQIPQLSAYLIALKLKRPELFARLADPGQSGIEAHTACKAFLRAEVDTLTRQLGQPVSSRYQVPFPGSYLFALSLIHTLVAGSSDMDDADPAKRDDHVYKELGQLPGPLSALMRVWRGLDLDVR
ncbi:KAP family P-loop domain-containing protein [Cupriavidus sp. YR651]|uniref:KAP family P-loop NTPase fold protein n=1 Tax=Cupriavidus sp. YR651 TaxID=1855315 RepID=UPI00088B74FF|nr:P-loop NTPase fold protein [Cupriavidus sp. YR651]SDC19380.1 KAP family P-loop domain-containing protein [Cupriavidus sp. YR651]